ncbi:MAG: hypothetical protein HY960_11535 [Ignavibacteriae bacterium]|nr:hypothetical protein [Ignavibacteriota bacterium]
MQNIHNQVVHQRGSYLSKEELHQGEKQVLHNFRTIRQIQSEPTPEKKREHLMSFSLSPVLQLELFA